MTQASDTTHAVRLDGKVVAAHQLASLSESLQSVLKGSQRAPKLVVVQVGEDPASSVYVKNKIKTAQSLGMSSEHRHLPESISEQALYAALDQLNQDASVDAILVQMPLPKHLDALSVIDRLGDSKDVDGFHPVHLGKLACGNPGNVLPCTPAGIIQILEHYQIPVEGKHAVVIGRSNIVGKPLSLMLLQGNATVTIAHSRTRNLSELTRSADILVAAVGVADLVTGDMVKPGAVVIDVGMNKKDGKLVGDIDQASVSTVAGYLTPVPGGVGPMTIAMLMKNTWTLYQQHILQV